MRSSASARKPSGNTLEFTDSIPSVCRQRHIGGIGKLARGAICGCALQRDRAG
jgi:hypothetical protein